MSAFLVSPTEPAELRRLGSTSGLPERHGCDVVWTTTRGELAGVQRKTLVDLWVSLRDGRLARELTAMQQLSLAALVLEGRLRWSTGGRLTTARAPMTRDHLRGVELSLQRRGIAVVRTDDVVDSASAVAHIRRWHDKARHPSLDLRPQPPDPPGTRPWAIHVLQSFPGIGPTVAGAIHDHFGRLPLAWTCTPADLATVRGVGPKRAAALCDALDGQVAERRAGVSP